MPDSQIQLQVGVKALIFNELEQVLIVQRSLNKYPDIKGRWDIPGGRIDPGTNLVSNLAREIKEETAMNLTGKPELLMAQDILHVPGKHIVRLTFKATAEGEIKLDTEENQAFKWKTITELKNFPDVDIFLTELLEELY